MRPLLVQDWPGGVRLLIEMCSGLARDEMVRVGALRKLRGDMRGMCRCDFSGLFLAVYFKLLV